MADHGDDGPVRLAETHSAVVLLCGDRAYKWKKATLRDSEGSPVEDALVMRRLPDERRLAGLVEAGADVEGCLSRVADTMADLHHRTVTPEAVEPASRSSVRRTWEDNLVTLRHYAGQILPSAEVEHAGEPYRAHVRAKVACLRSEQGDEHAPEEARRLHRLCLDHLGDGQVALVLVGGLPGTGKSTVARGLAEARGWALLSSDEVREELLGLDPGERAPGDAYTHDARTRVYTELLDRARVLLARGEPVVLDASWTEPAWRDAADQTAREASATPVAFLCQTPLAVAHDRVSRRAEQTREPSDATPEVLDRLAETAVPWPDAVRIDTTGEPDSVVGRADDLLRDRLRPRRV